MRFILVLGIIFWTVWYVLTSDASDGIKWVIAWGFIWFAWIYFQSRSLNYFDIRKNWSELIELFWNYQTICDEEEELLNNLEFEKELLDISLKWNSQKKIKEDEKKYYRLSNELNNLRQKKQLLRETIYAKAFTYFPKTEKLFREYTNLEADYYIETSDLKDKPALGRYNKLKNQEIIIQQALIQDIKSHNSFFT